MINQIPPGEDFELTTLSEDPTERHEQLVDVFGRLVMWMRRRAIGGTRKLVESDDARQQLAAILREAYNDAANLPPEARETALKLAEAAIDGFAQLLIRVLAHHGNDFPFGKDHAVRYVFDVEVVDRNSETVVLRETVNRNGRKHFADYWGRWLNRFGKVPPGTS